MRNVTPGKEDPIEDEKSKSKEINLPKSNKKFWILAVIFVLYIISPIDAIPDVLPGIGLLDDGGALTALLFTLFKIVKNRKLQDNDKD